ncbi:MAG: HAD hydrolase-like protein [Pikeienuella sp.]
MQPHVFLDLDGNLTESGIGITRSIAHALTELGVAVPEQSVLDSMIGPSLWEIFSRLGLPENQLDDAVALYRARYTTVGLFENKLYDGVIEMLEALSSAGCTLCLATAKPLAYASRITAHFAITPYLAQEFGSELDGTRTDKADLIAYALAKTGADPARSFMMGDRDKDVIGALANDVTPIGALWGYGSLAELSDAGCTLNAAAPAEAARMILERLP